MVTTNNRLRPVHHRFAILGLSLLVFIIGTFTGSWLRRVAGEPTLMVLLFGMVLLGVALLIALFVQVVHLREDHALARASVRKGGLR